MYRTQKKPSQDLIQQDTIHAMKQAHIYKAL